MTELPHFETNQNNLISKNIPIRSNRRKSEDNYLLINESEENYPLTFYSIAFDSNIYENNKIDLSEYYNSEYPQNILINFLLELYQMKIEDINISELSKKWCIELNIAYGYVNEFGSRSLLNLYQFLSFKIRDILEINNLLLPQLIVFKSINDLCQMLSNLSKYFINFSINFKFEEDLISLLTILNNSFNKNIQINILLNLIDLLKGCRRTLRKYLPFLCSLDRNSSQLINTLYSNSLIAIIDQLLSELFIFKINNYDLNDLKHFLNDIIQFSDQLISFPRYPKDNDFLTPLKNELQNLLINYNIDLIKKNDLIKIKKLLLLFQDKMIEMKYYFRGRISFNEYPIRKHLIFSLNIINFILENNDEDLLIIKNQNPENFLNENFIIFDKNLKNNYLNDIIELDKIKLDSYFLKPLNLNFIKKINNNNIQINKDQIYQIVSILSNSFIELKKSLPFIKKSLIFIIKWKKYYDYIYDLYINLYQEDIKISDIENLYNNLYILFNSKIEELKLEQIQQMRYQPPDILLEKIIIYSKFLSENLKLVSDQFLSKNQTELSQFYNGWVYFFDLLLSKCLYSTNLHYDIFLSQNSNLFIEYQMKIEQFCSNITQIDDNFPDLGIGIYSLSLFSIISQINQHISRLNVTKFNLDDVLFEINQSRNSFNSLIYEINLRSNDNIAPDIISKLYELRLIQTKFINFLTNFKTEILTNDLFLSQLTIFNEQINNLYFILINLRSKYDGQKFILGMIETRWKFIHIIPEKTHSEISKLIIHLNQIITNIINLFHEPSIRKEHRTLCIQWTDFFVKKINIFSNLIEKYDLDNIN